MILLGSDLRQLGYVRWTRNRLSPEALAAQRSLGREPPRTFRVPGLIGSGHLEGWTFTIEGTLPPGPHQPARLRREQRRDIVIEIQQRLGHLADNGEMALHGDFTPWNVRTIDGATFVLDWEEFRSGPIAADELWHAVTSALAAGTARVRVASHVRAQLVHYPARELRKAAAFWRRRETDQQPEEASQGTARSKRLLRFENKISAVLQAIEAD